MIERRPRAPVARSSALFAIAAERVLGEDQVDRVVVEEALVLLDERVLGLEQDPDQVFAVERVHRRDDRQAADELGDQAVGDQILRHHLREEILGRAVLARPQLGAEADRVAADAALDDLVEVGEGAAADEQDVGGVDRQELLVGVLAPALRRHARDRALEDLQERLLHALAADVAGDRGVVRLAGDLVDLVDVDDPGLGLLHVEVGRLDQLQQDVLDVLTDVPGLGQRGGVGDRERHVQDPGERLGQQRLAAAGGPQQQDVRLLQLDLGVGLARHLDALVVVVDRHRRASAWPPPAPPRSRSGRRRSPWAWAGCRGRAGREWSAPRR